MWGQNLSVRSKTGIGAEGVIYHWCIKVAVSL